MTSRLPHNQLSHTRAVPLINLAGLCVILSESKRSLHVRELVEVASRKEILELDPVPLGKPIPSRVNHHIISLRELELVRSEHRDSHVYYTVTSTGRRLAQVYLQSGSTIDVSDKLKAALRSVLVNSSYVRSNWLKYFMKERDFNIDDLLAKSSPISIIRLPTEEREESLSEGERFKDSGYRLRSKHWGEKIIYALERREILHGLRQWTNDVYLTDEGVPSSEAAPFAYLSANERDSHIEIESWIVQAWFDPKKDLVQFERIVDKVLDQRRQGNRIGIPDLIIAFSHDYGYARENIKEMLTVLFYRRRNKFFFERGSKFLVDNAFKLTRRDKPAAYYLNLEGSWRTSLVRSEDKQRKERR